MNIFSASDVPRPGYYWQIPDAGEWWPVYVFESCNQVVCQKPGGLVQYPAYGLYFGPIPASSPDRPDERAR